MAGRIDSRVNFETRPLPALRVDLLGTASLRLDDRTIALARKDAALLAILSLDGPTAAARLAALLWPDVDEKQAANNLRQRIFRLRKAAGQRFIEAGAAVHLAGEIATDLHGAIEAIELNPLPGELLGGLQFDDLDELGGWVQGARGRWQAQCAEALAAAASRCEKSGELARALQLAQQLVAQQPYAEHAHRRLMRLHYLRGDRAAALATLERCCELLRRELGAEPGRETQELAALIECSGMLAPRQARRGRSPSCARRAWSAATPNGSNWSTRGQRCEPRWSPATRASARRGC